MLRDTEHFSNASGMKAPGVVVPIEDRLLGELDPPRHTAVRRVMVTAITPKVVHQAEPFIVDTARELLAAAPDAFDLVTAFTGVLPNRVTVHLLGFAPDDADQLAVWAKALMESSFPAMNRTDRGEGFAAAFPEFAAYIDDRIAERTAQLHAGEPRADVLARLIELQVDGEPLPHRQVRALVRNLVTGGLTTTSQLLGNLLHELLAQPGIEHAIRAESQSPRHRHRGEPAPHTTPAVPGAFVCRGDRSGRMSGTTRGAGDRRDRLGEPRRARVRRRRGVPARPRQRRRPSHVRVRQPRLPRRDARRAGSRVSASKRSSTTSPKVPFSSDRGSPSSTCRRTSSAGHANFPSSSATGSPAP